MKIALSIGSLVLFALVGFFINQAQNQQAETDALQSLLVSQQREDARVVRVILTMGDCSTQADLNGDFFDGNTAVEYCAANGVGDFHPRLEQECFREGMRQAAGYIDFEEPTKEDYVELACGIAEKFPATTESWEDDSLTDGLRTLVNAYFRKN